MDQSGWRSSHIPYRKSTAPGAWSPAPLPYKFKHATRLGVDNKNKGRNYHVFKSPALFVIFTDTQGQSVYSWYRRENAIRPDAFTSITPLERHNGFFNAAFLAGHAEPCTYEAHYNEKYFTQPEP